MQELADAGAVNATYTTENDSYYGTLLHIQRTSGSLSRFPLYDEIGSARGLVDATGAVTDTYDMDTFGKPIGSTGSTPNPYRFGAAWGYITDPSSFLQLGARCYWPEVGRFVSQDPEGDGVNWYVYGDGNPVLLSDPTGLAAGTSLRGHGRPRGHGRASGRGGRGGAGLGGAGGRRPCPTPPARPKPKPKPRSPECKQCDAAYLQGWQAISAGAGGSVAGAAAQTGATSAATSAVGAAAGSAACGAVGGAAASAGGMLNVMTALVVNQKIYEDCCKAHHCEVLGASQLARGAGR